MTAATSAYHFSALLRAMRPTQWTKNAVVGAAFVFALGDHARTAPLGLTDFWHRVLPAMAIFCAISSGVYLLNDVKDLDADRNHPTKRFRPIAAGLIKPTYAAALGAVLIGASLVLASRLSTPFFHVCVAYVILQAVYTLWLKHLALVDVLVIASGFVLRALAGAVVLIGVTISPWLLLCTFLLAMFLGFCKRRDEKENVTEQGENLQRKTLDHYDRQLLDALIAITGGATIVCYSIYSLWPETVQKFGTSALGFTIPFVVFGIFRYLDLVYRQGKGERPDKVLLSDPPLLIDIALYGVAVVAILFLHK